MKNVAILGASGLVGQELLRILAERRFPVRQLKVLATSRSAGQTIEYMGEELTIEEARPEAFEGVDIAFFAASNDASRELAPEAVRRGCVVIDKSSYWRMDPEVPLAVPEVNPEAIRRHKGILASPNCSTIQLVMALHPLKAAAGLRRVVVSTYQSVSGTGKDAVEELRQQAPRVLQGDGVGPGRVYEKPIAFNVLARCDAFEANGYTKEEMKLTRETRKILEMPDLPISATAVRVPVFVGHSESVLVETGRPLSVEEAREALRRQPGVVVVDDPERLEYPDALSAAGRDEVFVGRIREDLSAPGSLWMWVVSDNLRKGAALNAVQIAEFLVQEGLA
ncbi:aspartate-semialdehyde dehydrogenase [Caldinitratiruptor microaerophilus]|uniref:Aspartate-semialdehyde dehydrogenase n=1 Tax=Caldinitratiruptor microaerophilus TaxID=671077 RepID=A0AA35CLD1_9FIRM|nr:aspartate-semialdehyde dehydrogenase [Caldinitratiruptor microaerophilus]BDG59425.1 aspartate-semialdehyde dehydrogenase [Caldinitratiruptor microaerophilus]